MAFRKHYDLRVWQDGIALVKLVYGLCEHLPKDELYGLTSQLRRASVSVPVNIAEGAARNGRKEFSHYLIIARGSLSEVDTLLIICNELGYLAKEQTEPVLKQLHLLLGALGALIKQQREAVP